MLPVQVCCYGMRMLPVHKVVRSIKSSAWLACKHRAPLSDSHVSCR